MVPLKPQNRNRDKSWGKMGYVNKAPPCLLHDVLGEGLEFPVANFVDTFSGGSFCFVDGYA